jgi:hypothetical protein
MKPLPLDLEKPHWTTYIKGGCAGVGSRGVVGRIDGSEL